VTPTLLPSLLLSVFVLASPRGVVETDGSRWQDVRTGAEELVLPGPWVADRDVELVREGDGLVIRGRWTLRSVKPGWFLGDLLGPGVEIRSATWNGRPAAIDRADEMTIVAGYVRDRATLVVEAFVVGDPASSPLTLDLMAAVSGRVTLPPAPEEQRLHVEDPKNPELPPARDGDVILSGAGRLAIRQRPRQPADTTALVTATAGIGLTVGDSDLRGRAQLTWTILRGAIDRVSFDARDLGADLEITGNGIREWRRVGDQIEVDLQASTRDLVALDLRWTRALAKATESSQPIPRLTPNEVFRGAHSLQIARDSEIEVIPTMKAWTAVASADLPSWGSGLVEGTPTAAYTANDGHEGQLSLLRFVPVESPPVVVDVAGITVATSREGRMLMRAHYEVRNERAAHLRVTPPPGMRILGAQVSGETALPARDKEGAWLIPLRRSIETVKGALSFPVEVTLLGESAAWARRERRSLPLPTVNAPVAVTRLTLHLPPGYTSRVKAGDGDVVDEFTRGEGINYGMGIGEVGVAEADARFQSAVGSWMNNDFKAAQADLDALRELGASNENIERLQANLDVIQGGEDKDKNTSGGDAAIERRIKEQAKARAADDIQRQELSKKKAEEYSRSGDYEKAEAEYTQAIEIGERLALLEQEESVEQQSTNEEIQRSYASVQKTKARRSRFRSKKMKRKEQAPEILTQTTSPDLSSGGGGGGGGHPRYDYNFEDDDIAGDLLNPDGQRVGAVDELTEVPRSQTLTATPAAPAAAAPAADGRDAEPPPGVTEDTGVEGNVDSSETMSNSAGVPVNAEPARNVPVGGTSSDFTSIVDLSPTAEDSAGIRLAGTTGAETKYVVDGANVSSPAFGTVGVPLVQEFVGDATDPTSSLFDRRELAAPSDSGSVLKIRPRAERRRSRRMRRGSKASAPPPSDVAMNIYEEDDGDSDGLPDEPDVATGSGGLGRLAAPEVQASAMSVVIPAAGEAVRYQRLLLTPGAPYSVEITAREPLLPRRAGRKRRKSRKL